MKVNSTVSTKLSTAFLFFILASFFIKPEADAQCPGNECNVSVTGGVEPVPMIINLNSPTASLTDAALSNEIAPVIGCGYGATFPYDFLVFDAIPSDTDTEIAGIRDVDCNDVGNGTIVLYAVLDDQNDGTVGTYDEDCDGRPVEIHITVNDAAPPFLNSANDCSTLDRTGANAEDCSVDEVTLLNTIAGEIEALYDDNCGTVTASTSSSLTYPSTGDCNPVSILEYTIEDASGNAVTCEVDVELVDNTAPAWEDPNISADVPDPSQIDSWDPVGNILRIRIDCDENREANVMAWQMWEPTAINTGGCNSVSVTDNGGATIQAFGSAPLLATCRVQREDKDWVAEDECGNSIAMDVRIRVFDNDAPTFDPAANPQDVTVNVDAGPPATCEADLTGTTTVEVTAEDCQTIDPSDYSYSINIVSGPTMADFETFNGVGSLVGSDNNADLIYPLGQYTITYTAEDPCGQLSTGYSVNLTVEDNQPPVISDCPSDINENTVTGDCSNTVSWAPPTVTDNCIGMITRTISTDNPTVVINESDPTLHFAQFPKGETEVIYTFEDAQEQTAICQFTVTIIDNEAPIFNDCDDQELLSVCPDAAVPDYTSNGIATDNCPMLTITQDPAAGTQLSAVPGLTLADGETFDVTLTVTDMAGLMDDCTFTVTLRDEDRPIPDVDPLPAINPSTTLDTDCGMYTLCAPTATDCNGNTVYGFATIAGANLNNSDPNCGGGSSYTFIQAGTWTINWTYDDGNGNIATQQQSVKIDPDTVAPRVECPVPNPLEVNTDANACTATNIADIDMEEVLPSITPYLDPSEAPGPGQGIDNCGITQWSYELSGATTVARKDGMDAGIETFELGTTTVTYYAIDAANNEGSCSFEVVVVDNQPPSVTCPNPMYILATGQDGDNLGDCAFEFTNTDYDPTGISDNCDDADVTVEYSISSITGGATATPLTGVSLQGLSVDLFAAANNSTTMTVDWVVTDGAGEIRTCQSMFTISDGEAPSIVCADDATRGISEDGNPSDCVYTVDGAEFDPVSTTDLCGVDYFENNRNNTNTLAGEDLMIGDNMITWTVYDEQGNSATCTTTITVEDDQAPSFDYCPDDVTLFNTLNECSQLHNWLQPSVAQLMDCDASANLMIERTSSDPVVEDALNNNYPWDPAVGGGLGRAEFPVGVTYVYYTAIDGSNNMETCTLTVTVLDNEAPVFSLCPSNQILGNICENDIVPDYRSLAEVEDNCSGFSLVQNPAPGTLLSDITGITPADGESFTVTLTATDQNPNGGETDCSFTVTLDDSEAPIPDIAGATLPKIYNSCSEVIVTAPTATDCGEVIYGVPDKGTFLGGNPPMYSFSTSLYNVNWTYTDNDNNTATQNQIIEVADDNTPPELTCPVPANMYLTGNEACSVTNILGIALSEGNLGDFTQGTYADTCTTDPDFTIEYQIQDGSGAVIVPRAVRVNEDAGQEVFPIGENTVTYFVTDEAGNESSCSFTIMVMDGGAPTIENLPANVTVSCENVPPAPVLTATDNCDGSIATSFNEFRVDGTCPDSYTLTRSWMATDAKGNSTEGQQIITVEDNTAPEIDLANNALDITVNNDLNACNAEVELILPLSAISDNCDTDVTITNSENTGGNDASGIYDVGTTTVIFTATDNCGNSTNYEVSVTVIDNEDPLIGCLQGVAFNLPSTGTLVLQPEDLYSTVRDNCPATLEVTMDRNTFTCADATGQFIDVVLTVTDASGNQAQCTSTVLIQDNIDPVAACQDITVELDSNGEVIVSGTQLNNGSTDNCNSALNFYIDNIGQNSVTYGCADIGSQTVTLIVEDGSGNTSTCSSTITIVDDIAPTAVCQDITLSLGSNGQVVMGESEVNGGSTDNCDNLIFDTDITSFDCSNLGANTVTLTVTDGIGNTDQCTAIVTIEDETAPVAQCQDITAYLNSAGNVAIDPSDVDNGSSDNCSSNLSYMLSRQTYSCIDTGEHTVTLTVMDEQGLSDQCTATVTVVDTVPPVVACLDVTLNLDANGMATLNVNQVWDAENTSDNCGIQHVRLSRQSFTCNDKNLDHEVEVTVTDVSGNSSTCIANVRVEDRTAPTLICKDITVNVDAGMSVDISAADVIDSVYDACGLRDTSINPTSFDCSDIGSSTVTVTATDLSGNVQVCTPTVTVEFLSPPTAACNDITVTLGEDGTLGEAEITAAEINNGSTDACGSTDQLTVSVDQTVFNCDDIGSQVVTLTVTDRFGNSSTCTSTVTVNPSELEVYLSDVGGDQGQTVMVPIRVNNFFEITSLQFTNEIVNGSVAKFVGGNPVGLSGASIDIISDQVASFQWNGNPNSMNLNDGDTIALLEIELTGTTGEMSDIIFTDVQNARLWSSTCYTTTSDVPLTETTDGSITVENSPAEYEMSGSINYYQGGAPVANVSVQITGHGYPDEVVQTDVNGVYSFTALAGSNPVITPLDINSGFYATERDYYLAKDIATQTVTSLDNFLIAQHIFGRDMLSGPYQLIAADVAATTQGSSCIGAEINTGDISEINAVLSQTSNSWAHNSWVFVPDNFTFTDVNCPWEDEYDQAISISTVAGAETGLDFTAIKIGDVNGSFTLNTQLTNGGDDEKSTSDAQLELELQREGNIVNFIVTHGEAIGSIQFGIKLKNILSDIEEVKVTDGLMQSAIATIDEKSGELLFTAFDPNTPNLSGQLLFQIHLAEAVDSDLDKWMNLSHHVLSNEVYSATHGLGKVVLNAATATNSDDIIAAGQFELLQNAPNPFRQTTNIRWILPYNAAADIVLLNDLGQKVYSTTVDGRKGLNTLQINNADLPSSGVYYYQVKTENFFGTKSMILTK